MVAIIRPNSITNEKYHLLIISPLIMEFTNAFAIRVSEGRPVMEENLAIL